MKQLCYIMTLLLAVLSGCQNIDRTSQEMSVIRIASNISPFYSEDDTKGYVQGETLYETATGTSSATTARDLHLTAHVYTPSETDRDYFVNETFIKGSSGWSHDPEYLWPLGGQIDFLSYSASTPFDADSIEWGADNAATRMRLTVSKARTQDDILYASAWGVGSDGNAVDLQYLHSQAWLRMALKNDGASSIRIDSVVVTDSFMEGVLEVRSNYGHPEVEWDFRSAKAEDHRMDDIYSVCGTVLSSSTVYIDMLIPEQEKKPLNVHYTKGGVAAIYQIEVVHERWLAGRRYTYDITWTD